MTTVDLLAMQAISLRYGPTLALDAVDFTVRPGEVHALLGENGAGKSSLMQVIAGAVQPSSGTMRLRGALYAPDSPSAAQRAGVAMVFQELSVLAHLTIAENLWLGRERARAGFVDRRARTRAARQVLARIGLGELDPDRRVGHLAPAERQMVEIARAVLADATVLVVDEPTSSLGAADVQHLFTVLLQLRDAGLGIVFISHSLEEVRTVCDRCTILRDGRLVATGELATMDDATLVQHMAGRPLGQVFPAAGRSPGDVVLSIQHLAGAPLPIRASLQLHRGEIAGIAGLCGAGRSELLAAIFGLLPRTAGLVRMHGHELPADPRQCWRLGVGFCAEDRKQQGLSLRLPIGTNIAMPRLLPFRRSGFLRWRLLWEATAAIATRVSVVCRSSRQRAAELSGGNQQKVALARLLHAGCSVLLLDEPTRGIDVGSRQEIYQLLDKLARGGAAILVVSSQLPELLGLCDRIAVMHRGRLGTFRDAAQWSQEALLHEAMVGAFAEAATP